MQRTFINFDFYKSNYNNGINEVINKIADYYHLEIESESKNSEQNCYFLSNVKNDFIVNLVVYEHYVSVDLLTYKKIDEYQFEKFIQKCFAADRVEKNKSVKKFY